MRRILEALLPRRLGASFRWLVASYWISNLGDGFALAAGPLLVAAKTRDASLVALATLLQRLPWLAFGVFAGALTDRRNRAAIVAAVDLFRAAVLAVLAVAVLTGRAGIGFILVVMFVLGTAEVFSNTASGSILPSLVGRSDLTLANARLQTGFVTVYQLVGPPVGAALFAVGMSLPFLGQAVLVGVGALLVTRVRLPARQAAAVPATPAPPAVPASPAVAVPAVPAAPPPAARPAPPPAAPAAPAPGARRVSSEIAEGFRWAFRHPAVRTLVLTIFTFNITFGAAWSILVLYATERLHMGAIGYGLLTTAAAAGGILGTISYGWITRRVSLGNIMRIGLIIETFTHLSLALTTVPAVALAIMVVFGAHAFIWGTTSVTVRQRAVPEELQGRVSSVNSVGVYGGLVLGAALGGPIADRWGITAPFWFAFVGSAVFVVLIWRQLAYIAHDDEPFPPAPESASAR